MKTKINLLTVITLFTGIILSSCNSSLTITKRQHSKGYYISTGRIKSADLTQKNVKPAPQLIENENITSKTQDIDLKNEAVIKKSSSKAIESSSLEGLKNEDQQLTNNSDNKIIKKEKINPKKTNTQATQFAKLKSAHTLLKESKSSFKSGTKKAATPVVGEALSLLWILILVLVILWLLGFLAGGLGLGGLLNILLLIALVLLILWLLRII